MINSLRVWIWPISVIFLAYCFFKIPTLQDRLSNPIYSTDRLTAANSLSAIDKVEFRDVTLVAGIQRPHTQRSEQLSGIHESLGAGACAFDYNRDGWLDLLVLNGSGTTHFYGKPQWWQQSGNSLTLYENNRDGTFKDVTKNSGFDSSAWTMGCTSADLDNDGDEDLFISNYGQNQLWRNNGDGSFTDVTRDTGIGGNGWSTAASVSDVNSDGLLDLYVSNYLDFKTNSLTFEQSAGFKSATAENFEPALYSGLPNKLLINQGNLKFTDFAGRYGLANAQGRSLSSHWFDIDGNGYPDLIVANDKGSANKVYLNRDGAAFTDISTDSRLAFVDKASSAGLADFDNDGSIEIFVSTDNTLFPRLYTQNQASPGMSGQIFADISDSFELQRATTAGLSHWGNAIGDFNLDGWVDLFLANGFHTPDQNARLIPRGQVNILLINDGGRRFVRQSKNIAAETYPSFSSRCALPFDFNNNGALDIYLTNNNSLGQLLRNSIPNRQWLGVEILSHNRTAYGAKAELKMQTKEQPATLEKFVGQNSFLCSGDQRLIFGLNRIKPQSWLQLNVTWPDGTQRNYENLAMNRYYRVHKEKAVPEPLSFAAMDNSSRINLVNPRSKLKLIQWLIPRGHSALAARELTLLMQQADENLRFQALEASRQLPVRYRNAIIQQAISDQSANLRIAAIEMVRTVEDERFNRWLLRQLEHDNPAVACHAAAGFAHFFDQEEAMLLTKYTALSPLIRLAQSAETKKQICAIDALGRSERYRALQPLMDLLGATSNEVRLAAVKALGLLKERAATRPLENLFLANTESARIRAQALIALKQISNEVDIRSLLERASGGQVEKSFLPVVGHARYQADNRIVIRRDIQAFIHDNNLSPLIANDAVKVSSNSEVSSVNCDVKENILPADFDVYLGQCLSPTAFHKIMPIPIKLGLARGDIAILEEIFRRIAARKERWARESTASTLKDENSSMAIRKTIVENLPDRLSPSLVQLLSRIFVEEPDSEIAPLVAQRLIKSGELGISDLVFARLKMNLDRGNDDKALLYAEALLDSNAERIFALFIHK